MPTDKNLNKNKKVNWGDRTSLGHLKDDLTWNTSIRAGKTESVRLPRGIQAQNRKGLGNPYK